MVKNAGKEAFHIRIRQTVQRQLFRASCALECLIWEVKVSARLYALQQVSVKRRLELVWGQGDRFAVVTGVPVFVTNLVVLCRLGDAIDGNRQ